MTGIGLMAVALFCCTFLQAQNVKIEATVMQLPVGKIYISQIRGEEHKLVDSVFVSGSIVRFNLKDPQPGVYRLTLGKAFRADILEEEPQFFDIIINQENFIQVKTNFNFPIDSMKILNSLENQIYYKFLRASKFYRNKAGHLLPLFSFYKPGDDFYDHLNNEFFRLHKEHTDSLLNWANQVPGSFASSLLKFSLLPLVDPFGGFYEMTEFLKSHYFDLVTFSDERLIYSQAYTQKILEFLNLYRIPEKDQAAQEEQFIKAVDIIMERVSYNEKVYEFILNFLIDGFDLFKMEKVLLHLAENYVEKGCETDSRKIMEQRLEGYKRMAEGNKVNDIVLMDSDGKTKKLSELKNEYVLILFWSSWCQHCTRLLPELKKWYENEKTIDLEVFSVSIDTSRFDWEENLLTYGYPWINVCNFQGWEGKVASDYNIYATPTMFIVDRERQILAKPLTLREFKKELDKIGQKRQFPSKKSNY